MTIACPRNRTNCVAGHSQNERPVPRLTCAAKTDCHRCYFTARSAPAAHINSVCNRSHLFRDRLHRGGLVKAGNNNNSTSYNGSNNPYNQSHMHPQHGKSYSGMPPDPLLRPAGSPGGGPPDNFHPSDPPFSLSMAHVFLFVAILVGGIVYLALTLQVTSPESIEFKDAMLRVGSRVLNSIAFRQLLVIASLILLVRFGLNWLVRYLGSWTKVNFDRTKTYYVIKEVYQPLELLLFIAGVCTIADAFVPQLISVPKNVVSHFVRATLAVSFIVCAASMAMRFKRQFCQENAWQAEMNGDITSQRRWEAYDKLGTFAVYVLAFIFVVQAVGLEVTSVLAIGGVGGLAIGLAGREIFENLFNGFLILTSNPFEVGDEVCFYPNGNKVEGLVMDIGWYRTLIRSFEREVYIIPNAVFSKNTVLNITRKGREWRFFEMISVRVQDVSKVNAIVSDMRRIIKNDSRILNSLHKRVYLDKITMEDIKIYISFYVEAATRDVFMTIKQDFLLGFIDCMHRNGAQLAQKKTMVELVGPSSSTASAVLDLFRTGAQEEKNVLLSSVEDLNLSQQHNQDLSTPFQPHIEPRRKRSEPLPGMETPPAATPSLRSPQQAAIVAAAGTGAVMSEGANLEASSPEERVEQPPGGAPSTALNGAGVQNGAVSGSPILSPEPMPASLPQSTTALQTGPPWQGSLKASSTSAVDTKDSMRYPSYSDSDDDDDIDVRVIDTSLVQRSNSQKKSGWYSFHSWASNLMESFAVSLGFEPSRDVLPASAQAQLRAQSQAQAIASSPAAPDAEPASLNGSEKATSRAEAVTAGQDQLSTAGGDETSRKESEAAAGGVADASKNGEIAIDQASAALSESLTPPTMNENGSGKLNSEASSSSSGRSASSVMDDSPTETRESQPPTHSSRSNGLSVAMTSAPTQPSEDLANNSLSPHMTDGMAGMPPSGPPNSLRTDRTPAVQPVAGSGVTAAVLPDGALEDSTMHITQAGSDSGRISDRSTSSSASSSVTGSGTVSTATGHVDPDTGHVTSSAPTTEEVLTSKPTEPAGEQVGVLVESMTSASAPASTGVLNVASPTSVVDHDVPALEVPVAGKRSVNRGRENIDADGVMRVAANGLSGAVATGKPVGANAQPAAGESMGSTRRRSDSDVVTSSAATEQVVAGERTVEGMSDTGVRRSESAFAGAAATAEQAMDGRVGIRAEAGPGIVMDGGEATRQAEDVVTDVQADPSVERVVGAADHAASKGSDMRDKRASSGDGSSRVREPAGVSHSDESELGLLDDGKKQAGGTGGKTIAELPFQVLAEPKVVDRPRLCEVTTVEDFLSELDSIPSKEDASTGPSDVNPVPAQAAPGGSGIDRALIEPAASAISALAAALPKLVGSKSPSPAPSEEETTLNSNITQLPSKPSPSSEQASPSSRLDAAVESLPEGMHDTHPAYCSMEMFEQVMLFSSVLHSLSSANDPTHANKPPTSPNVPHATDDRDPGAIPSSPGTALQTSTDLPAADTAPITHPSVASAVSPSLLSPPVVSAIQQPQNPMAPAQASASTHAPVSVNPPSSPPTSETSPTSQQPSLSMHVQTSQSSLSPDTAARPTSFVSDTNAPAPASTAHVQQVDSASSSHLPSMQSSPQQPASATAAQNATPSSILAVDSSSAPPQLSSTNIPLPVTTQDCTSSPSSLSDTSTEAAPSPYMPVAPEAGAPETPFQDVEPWPLNAPWPKDPPTSSSDTTQPIAQAISSNTQTNPPSPTASMPPTPPSLSTQPPNQTQVVPDNKQPIDSTTAQAATLPGPYPQTTPSQTVASSHPPTTDQPRAPGPLDGLLRTSQLLILPEGSAIASWPSPPPSMDAYNSLSSTPLSPSNCATPTPENIQQSQQQGIQPLAASAPSQGSMPASNPAAGENPSNVLSTTSGEPTPSRSLPSIPLGSVESAGTGDRAPAGFRPGLPSFDVIPGTNLPASGSLSSGDQWAVVGNTVWDTTTPDITRPNDTAMKEVQTSPTPPSRSQEAAGEDEVSIGSPGSPSSADAQAAPKDLGIFGWLWPSKPPKNKTPPSAPAPPPSKPSSSLVALEVALLAQSLPGALIPTGSVATYLQSSQQASNPDAQSAPPVPTDANTTTPLEASSSHQVPSSASPADSPAASPTVLDQHNQRPLSALPAEQPPQGDSVPPTASAPGQHAVEQQAVALDVSKQAASSGSVPQTGTAVVPLVAPLPADHVRPNDNAPLLSSPSQAVDSEACAPAPHTPSTAPLPHTHAPAQATSSPEPQAIPHPPPTALTPLGPDTPQPSAASTQLLMGPAVADGRVSAAPLNPAPNDPAAGTLIARPSTDANPAPAIIPPDLSSQLAAAELAASILKKVQATAPNPPPHPPTQSLTDSVPSTQAHQGSTGAMQVKVANPASVEHPTTMTAGSPAPTLGSTAASQSTSMLGPAASVSASRSEICEGGGNSTTGPFSATEANRVDANHNEYHTDGSQKAGMGSTQPVIQAASDGAAAPAFIDVIVDEPARQTSARSTQFWDDAANTIDVTAIRGSMPPGSPPAAAGNPSIRGVFDQSQPRRDRSDEIDVSCLGSDPQGPTLVRLAPGERSLSSRTTQLERASVTGRPPGLSASNDESGRASESYMENVSGNEVRDAASRQTESGIGEDCAAGDRAIMESSMRGEAGSVVSRVGTGGGMTSSGLEVEAQCVSSDGTMSEPDCESERVAAHQVTEAAVESQVSASRKA